MRVSVTVMVTSLAVLTWIGFILIMTKYSKSVPRHRRTRYRKSEEKPPEKRDLTNFLVDMLDRVLDVNEKCASISQDYNKTVNSVAELVHSRHESLLYCPLETASGPAFLSALLQTNNIDITQHNLPAIQNLILNQFTVIHNVKEYKDSKAKYKMIVVRHPLERLLACYREKLEGGINEQYYFKYGKDIVRNFRELPYKMTHEEILTELNRVDADRDAERVKGNVFANPVGPTFTEFIQYILSPSAVQDQCWATIVNTCDPCTFRYSFILRYENIASESADFLQLIKSTFKINPQDEEVFGGPPQTSRACSFYSQLQHHTIQELIQKYFLDFYIFEYDSDLYMNCLDSYVAQGT